MKVYSNYLKKEIELPSFDVFEGDRATPVVQYNALKHFIYGEEQCVQNGVQAHYNPVVVEPGHYAFICTISDDSGRRVEGFGESLPATLDTKIAQDYPSLMAAKRAFSDAALLFLGIPDAYSDAQISKKPTANNIPMSSAEYSQRVAAEKPAEKPVEKPVENAPQKKATKKAPKEKEKETAEPAPAPVAEAPAEEDPASSLFDDIDSVLGDIPFESDDDSNGVADDLQMEDLFNDLEADNGSDETVDAPSEPVVETPVEAVPEAPAPDPVPAEPAKPEAAVEFDFEKEIVSIGAFKAKPVSVVEAYKIKPDSVDWIANKMRSSNPDRIHQQKVCAAYLKHIGK